MGFSKREAPKCDWCPYRKNCLYEFLSQGKSKKEWRELRIARRFQSGEKIFYEGTKPQGLYVVCRGHVKVCKTSRTGEQLLTRIEKPGDLLGHVSLLIGGPYAANAESMGETVVSLIDEEKFMRFLRDNPDATLAILRALSLDVRRGEDRARDIAYKPARARLAGILLQVFNNDGHGRARQPSYPIELKRKELAEMAGLTTETTVRLLKDFEERQLIKKQKRAVVVLDAARLEPLTEAFS
ncbi:MAG: Crp/Fnr family transcriptional regulator [Elusimicrobia bacterium]|nr:Crp/Fnr family transcriptional regulator [Elusimicrobiota bacterium]